MVTRRGAHVLGQRRAQLADRDPDAVDPVEGQQLLGDALGDALEQEVRSVCTTFSATATATP